MRKGKCLFEARNALFIPLFKLQAFSTVYYVALNVQELHTIIDSNGINLRGTKYYNASSFPSLHPIRVNIFRLG